LKRSSLSSRKFFKSSSGRPDIFLSFRPKWKKFVVGSKHAHASLKSGIAERCRVVNSKKAALDAKTDTSMSTQRLELLEKELEDLKERVRATERLIQDEKNLIANSKQEAEDLTTQLKIELAELST
jgi:predicted  nucleic acid-binding Zn-ribbon protein